MALTLRVMTRSCFFKYSVTQPVRHTIQKFRPIRISGCGICYQNDTNNQIVPVKPASLSLTFFRKYAVANPCTQDDKAPEEKKGLIKRLKEMYRDYWYVVVPVHMFTSAIWFGGFYYAVRSGVDVIAILQSIGLSDKIIAPLRDSSAGYVALTFAMYKLATPLRYAVTVGGTTYAIKKLTTMGWIKPVPSKERIKELYQEKKGNIQCRINESKEHYRQVKQKSSLVMDEMRRYKTEMRNIKNKVKK